MTSDPNKKSARTFQCRDMLWETFEQMARELECSVDYLINEAMKQYARSRQYGGSSRGGYAPTTGRLDSGQNYPSAPPPPMTGTMRAGGGGAGLGPPPPPPRGSGGGGGGLPPPPPRGNLPVPPPPPRGGGGGGGFAPPPMARGVDRPPPGRSAPPSAPRSAPPPIPGGRGGMNGGYAPQAHGATLAIIYQGEKFTVAKDRFVIGRGKQSSDLTLKDPNVSRQHAMVEYQNGVYFMVDMGSTNGVEYNGQRIARKQIAEGDVFRICDHDLRFTYR
ncbi:MAG: FHA domain-containing protein [Myxococcales bacterium]|jgi:hypothetical protein|nr:FHA domain-containing protein [Myxococcales bacterium]